MRRDIRTRLGERVRALRQVRGWTQEDLGERSALSYKFIGQIERGHGNPSIDTLQRLSAALEVDITELFGRNAVLKEGYALTAEELARMREAIDSADDILKRVSGPRRAGKHKRR